MLIVGCEDVRGTAAARASSGQRAGEQHQGQQHEDQRRPANEEGGQRHEATLLLRNLALWLDALSVGPDPADRLRSRPASCGRPVTTAFFASSAIIVT